MPRMRSSSWARQLEISWPSVIGVASCRCVRPIFTEGGMPLLQRQEDVAKMSHRRQEAVVDHLHRGDVHRRRKRVVARLATVDVVIGMDGLLRAHHAAGDLDGTVRDHLVGIHVRLRAAAGLKHDERKMVVELSGDHLVGGLDDQLHRLRRQLAQFAVRQGRRTSSGCRATA